jgi:hypothetical protein
MAGGVAEDQGRCSFPASHVPLIKVSIALREQSHSFQRQSLIWGRGEAMEEAGESNECLVSN